MTLPLSAPHARDAVSLRHVGKVYRGTGAAVTALDAVSLDIAEGAFVCIVGRSGCGKSTLLRMIAGLLECTAGSLVVEGAVVDGPPPAARYVFQDYGESLFPWKTVAANVAFGIRGHRMAGADGKAETPAHIAARYLDLVGLADVGQRYPWELSGGMQQRVAIARALASGPRLLLMDEPFGAVDALSRAKLQDMVLDLWTRLGLTIVLVTHDIDEALYLADRVIVLKPGGGGMQSDLAVELPRPRSQIATREHPTFGQLRRHLYDLVLS